jgi:transcriptional regulator with XRE-family HTH domain
MSYLGKNIELVRRWLRESQTEFGTRLGVKRSAIGKWESGLSEPPVSALLSLEELSGVPFRRLASELLALSDLDTGEGKRMDLRGEIDELKRRVEQLENAQNQ